MRDSAAAAADQLTATAACPPGHTATPVEAMLTSVAASYTRLIFVGERPSHRAVQIGATWANGHLAGKTLRDALLAAGLNPNMPLYRNVYSRPDAGPYDALDERATQAWLTAHVSSSDVVVIGLGHVVCRWLGRMGIAHVPMIHPAARGRIRQRACYQEHVRAVLATIWGLP